MKTIYVVINYFPTEKLIELKPVNEGDIYNNQKLPQDFKIKEKGGLIDLVA